MSDNEQNRPSDSKLPAYWSTLEELRGDAEVERLKREEFYTKPAEYIEHKHGAEYSLSGEPNLVSEAIGFVAQNIQQNGGNKSGLSRRDFLKISSAAVAFATAGCALRPTRKIVPYVKAPEEIVPGIANYYASTLSGSTGTGVLVKTREGRPIKIEGNPSHPLSQGKLDVRGQLAIFNLYDPDRLQAPAKLQRSNQSVSPITWAAADEEIGKSLKEAKGQIVLLTGTIHGPARQKLVRQFLAAFPAARHVEYDAWNYEATRSAQEKCYDSSVLPHYRTERAEYILNLNIDPLGSHYSSLEWSVGFGKNRQLRDGKMSKVVTVEPFMTMTGANSDERYRVRSADVLRVAYAIAAQIVVSGGHLLPTTNDRDGKVKSALAKYSNADSLEKEVALPSGTIKRIAKDLWENRRQSLVMAGEDESLQIVANLINTICENDGRTVDGTMSPSRQSHGSAAEMLSLVTDMKAGKVDVLIVHGTNPGFTLPPASGFVETLKNVKTIVSLNDRIDETAQYGDYALPGLHWLENWGDAEPQAGMYSLTQPSILPLFDNRAAEDSLIFFARSAGQGDLAKFEGGWHEFVKDTWNKEVFQKGNYPATFDDFWIGALRDGVLNTVIDTEGTPRIFLPEAMNALKSPSARITGLELIVYPSPIQGDGFDANNAWLLETPDPVSRINWTNYASMSVTTAERLGIKEGDIVLLEAAGISVELPAHVQPGDTEDVISVQTGWGRSHAGRIGDNVGVNAFAFRQVVGNRLVTSGISCKISQTGRWEKMPCVQGHNYIEGRPIIADASLEEFLKDPHTGQPHAGERLSMWPEYKYDGHRWGMVIDLSACIGCNACISACQVENNIPVVGKEQILRGRELHWMRIDRYYSGEPDQPEVVHQPMLCQHCENAPCETVCPVLATVHNEEGLNLQVYNRCVGTRYCSNNCPYKVRRFNWFEYSFTAYDQYPLQLALNPDVTVREKGIMEKCNFCLHRIRGAKEKAKELGRKVNDSDLMTACQQTCPTGAIQFGDWNNPDSDVAKGMKDERGFHVLEELNTRPSVTYWTKLRNRPPRISDKPVHHNESEGKHS